MKAAIAIIIIGILVALVFRGIDFMFGFSAGDEEKPHRFREWLIGLKDGIIGKEPKAAKVRRNK